MSHHMPAIGGGFVWPDLAFRDQTGQQISAVLKRHHVLVSEELSPVRYLNSFSAVIDASAFEKQCHGVR